MSIAAYIPWLDIFLGLILIGLIALGFWQGLLKELWFLISLYLGAVLASLYGEWLGGWIARGLGSGSAEVASAWGFFIVIVLATAILFSILWTLFRHLRIRSSLLVLDKIGGITLGVLTSFFITSFVAYVLYAILGVRGPQEWAFVAILKDQRETSVFLSLFRNTRLVLMTIVAPWLPDLPRFLR